MLEGYSGGALDWREGIMRGWRWMQDRFQKTMMPEISGEINMRLAK